MTWQDALEIMVARTKHERYRWLTSDDNPDVAQREGYRASLVRQASDLPPLIQQASNAIEAVGRAVGAALTGQPVLAATHVADRRWAICAACPELEGDRCRVCGCHMRAKSALSQEACPIGKW